MKFAKPIFLIAVLSLLFAKAGLLSGQSTTRVSISSSPGASCPVHLDSLSVRHDKLSFVYRNTTDNTIRGIDFGAAYFDPVQDPHLVRVDGGFNKLLKSGRRTRSSLDIRYWRNTGYTGWLVWPQKILYTDGKIWEEGQERASCGIEHWVIKYVRAPVPPDEVLFQKLPPPTLSGK
jgi:hypothetical protein